MNPDRLAERGVKSAGQDIFYIFWTYLHFLWCIISISSCEVSKYTWIWSQISFLGQKEMLVHFERYVIFAQYFDHIWPAISYRAWSCAGQRAHDSKCLNDVYKAYRVNHILYKKFLVKPNWVKIRQILGGGAILDLMLIWKLGPDRVKVKPSSKLSLSVNSFTFENSFETRTNRP